MLVFTKRKIKYLSVCLKDTLFKRFAAKKKFEERNCGKLFLLHWKAKLTTNLEHVLSIMLCNIKTFHPSCCLKENELERMCLKKEIARIKTRLVLKAFKIPLYFSNHAISPKTIIFNITCETNFGWLNSDSQNCAKIFH